MSADEFSVESCWYCGCYGVWEHTDELTDEVICDRCYDEYYGMEEFAAYDPIIDDYPPFDDEDDDEEDE